MKNSLKILALCSILLMAGCGRTSSSESSSETSISSSQSSVVSSETPSVSSEEVSSITPSSETPSVSSEVISEDSSEEPSEVSSEIPSEEPSETDLNDYVDDAWTPVGDEKGYIYEGATIVNNVNDANIINGYLFEHDQPKMNIHNTEVGANYSVAVDFDGTYNGNVDKVIYGGIVAWYQDVNNYVVVGVQWADFDRPHEIRQVFVTGKVGGTRIAWADFWTDNCGVFPADGVELMVTKVGKNFAFNLRGDNHAVKEGSVNVNGTDTDTAKVGIVAVNDRFVFSNFETAVVIPDTSVTYNLTSGTDVYQLVVYDDNSAILKHTADGIAQPDKVGTYVADGRNLTLTFGEETLYVKVYDTTKTFEFYVPEAPDEDALVLDGSEAIATSVLRENVNGDIVIDTDFVGTITEPGHAIKVGFNPWYVDENNYIDVYIEWSNADRPHEIRAMQITGKLAGETIGWFDIWCDGSNKLVSDGFHFTLTKAGKDFSVALTSGLWSKTGTRTVNNIDTNLAYSVKAYALGDEISFSNLEVYQDQSALYDVSEEGVASIRDTGIVINAGTTIITKATSTSNGYTLTTDFKGTITEPGHAIKVGFYPWYIDEDNFINVYIEWSNAERAHEIRAMQITGEIGGTFLGWYDIWCDGSNKLVADGFQFQLVKESGTFSVSLTSGEWTKTGSKTFPTLNTELPYKMGYYALGDTITYKNLLIA